MYPEAETDRSLTTFYTIRSDFFCGHERTQKADGVKGYVARGRICGLRFRRNEFWDEEPLGRTSAHECVFLLFSDEQFSSVAVSQNERYNVVAAVTVRIWNPQNPKRSVLLKVD